MTLIDFYANFDEVPEIRKTNELQKFSCQREYAYHKKIGSYPGRTIPQIDQNSRKSKFFQVLMSFKFCEVTERFRVLEY